MMAEVKRTQDWASENRQSHFNVKFKQNEELS